MLRSRSRLELPFLRRLRLHLLGKQKKPCSFVKYDVRAIYKGNILYYQKNCNTNNKVTNFSVWSQSRLEPHFFALSLSRPNLVGADSSDFRSCLKKWRIRITAFFSSYNFAAYCKNNVLVCCYSAELLTGVCVQAVVMVLESMHEKTEEAMCKLLQSLFRR